MTGGENWREEGPDDEFGPDDEAIDLEDLMAGFRHTSGGATARFAAGQAAIIRDLVGQVVELIGGDPQADEGALGPEDVASASQNWREDGQVGADELAVMTGMTDNPDLVGGGALPDDPVLARLLPDAYSDNPEASGEFRRYTEPGLRSGKAAAARTVLATLPPSGGRVRLSEPEAQAWLRALNDVRLALGTRLGVTDDFDAQVADMGADDPRSPYVGVYQWLAYLQESLVQALS
ncbi:MAG TPA: DUF2017 domain-containing protein [Streptosporangiaceae bacterium]